MKYLSLIFVLLVLSLEGVAQFNAGDKFISGTFGFSSQNSPTDLSGGISYKRTTFSFTPQVGFFLNEKIALGGSIGYSSIRNKESAVFPGTSSTYQYTQFSIGLMVRRYFQISDAFFISIEGSPFYSSYEEDYATLSSPTKGRSLGLTFRPVFSFFPSKRWAVETGFGSVGVNVFTNENLDRKTTSFSLDYGVLNFGLAYYIR
jgi:hypothetical protein